jgi:hypothetical protein
MVDLLKPEKNEVWIGEELIGHGGKLRDGGQKLRASS